VRISGRTAFSKTPGRTQVKFSFETAWSPPEPIIKKLTEMYPSLIFALDYEESNEANQGHLVCEGGVVKQVGTFDYYW
jgi:hypothetical protein